MIKKTRKTSRKIYIRNRRDKQNMDKENERAKRIHVPGIDMNRNINVE